MKDYYQILRVRRGAGAAEIRRAYRVLVQKLHPDINPDPAAHELIKEINEAYDVLGDAVKKQDYDYRLDNPYSTVSTPQEPVHRDPAYRRSKSYAPPVREYSQMELMRQYLPFMLWFCRAGLLFSIVLFTDAILPSQTVVDEISEIYRVRTTRHRAYAYDIVETKGGLSIKLYDHEATYFYKKPKIKVDYSSILSIPISVYGEDGSHKIMVGFIYRTLVFLPILLLSTSVLGLFFRERTEFSFSLSIVSALLLVITGYLIF